jgi:hypothetical protein
MERLLDAISSLFTQRPEFAEFCQLHSEDERVRQTFCGT